MADERILLIDDDETLLALLGDYLDQAGFQLTLAESGAEGLHLAGKTEPDLIILDVMMPGMDGWTVCERLRTRFDVPIIMLTAKGEEIDKLRGFHLGVDDYVTKPFSFAELAARIRAILSRVQRPVGGHHQLASGDLAIDFDRRSVEVAGQAVDLTPTEYRLLETLALRAGRAVPSERLLLEVWGPAYEGEVEHVKHYIWSLRQKIEADSGDPQHILTERGFGYRFE